MSFFIFVAVFTCVVTGEVSNFGSYFADLLYLVYYDSCLTFVKLD